MGKKSKGNHKNIIAKLDAHRQPVQPDDLMAEAGRKVLLGEFHRMLSCESGSRRGEDIEAVHKMRVAIRQQRSAFRLLKPYYKPKAIRQYDRSLRDTMRALGPVRDLDVMIHDLRAFDLPLDEVHQAGLNSVIEALDQRRLVAHENLIHLLDSKSYRRFVSEYGKFLTTPGAAAQRVDDEVIAPVQVRHVLPPMIAQHLAAVRAYDPVLAEADAETFHALRIEFKRLRYVVTLFSGLLGKEIDDFIAELKKMQDLLGRMNDIEVARESLIDLMSDLEGDQTAALWIYVDDLENEKPGLHEQFPALWKRFNTKTVQRKLAQAVTVL